jgi:HAD superfamily hydrolase (TIGR01509 family)
MSKGKIVKNTIIFDMDGLMIDSERLTFEGYQAVLEKMGLGIDIEFYKTVLGCPVSVIGQRFKTFYGEEFPFNEVLPKVHAYMNAFFHSSGIPLKRGLLPLLDYLQRSRCAVAVATSSDRYRVEDILRLANIAHYFHFIVCGDEVKHGKPDPEVFLKCCEKAKCDSDDAIVLEDSEQGILASFRAGITCFAIPDLKVPGGEYAQMAYRVMDSLCDVLETLKESGEFTLQAI